MANFNANLDFFGKRIVSLEKAVGRKENEIRKEMEEDKERLEREYSDMSRRLHEATERAMKMEIARPEAWEGDIEIPEITVTPAQAIDVTARITEAVARARRELTRGASGSEDDGEDRNQG